jgi:hypothetical protein
MLDVGRERKKKVFQVLCEVVYCMYIYICIYMYIYTCINIGREKVAEVLREVVTDVRLLKWKTEGWAAENVLTLLHMCPHTTR